MAAIFPGTQRSTASRKLVLCGSSWNSLVAQEVAVMMVLDNLFPVALAEAWSLE